LMNNPLSATDPSGYWKISIGGIVKGIAGIFLGIATAGIGLAIAGAITGATIALTSLAGAIISGAGFSFGNAFAGSLLSGRGLGASFRAAFRAGVIGGLSAGATHGVGTFFGNHARFAKLFKPIAHGIIQGTASVADGGKFKHGFLAGWFTTATESFTRRIQSHTGKIAVAAIVGGTASVLGGGKFANGAISGAFIMLYNNISHPKSNLEIGECPAGRTCHAEILKSKVGIKNSVMDFFNIEIAHEHIVFKITGLSNFMGNRNWYESTGKYDFEIMRKVVNQSINSTRYGVMDYFLVGNNCQNYVNSMRTNYAKEAFKGFNMKNK
jgi:hypothetical protein